MAAARPLHPPSSSSPMKAGAPLATVLPSPFKVYTLLPRVEERLGPGCLIIMFWEPRYPIKELFSSQLKSKRRQRNVKPFSSLAERKRTRSLLLTLELRVNEAFIILICYRHLRGHLRDQLYNLIPQSEWPQIKFQP